MTNLGEFSKWLDFDTAIYRIRTANHINIIHTKVMRG